MSPLRELYGGRFQPSAAHPIKLVVVLPAFNEEKSVAQAIRQIQESLTQFPTMEIIVVNDGSSDETSARALAAGARVIDHRTNEGLGVAIATGVDAAIRCGADIIVTMDSDGQFKGSDVPELIALLIDGRADIVIGSRYLRKDYIPEGTPPSKLFASKVLNVIVSQIVWGKKLTDVTCGFRAYTRDAAIRLSFLSRFTYTVESIIDAYYKGLCLTEVPVRVRRVREHGKSKMTANFPLYTFGIFLILLRRMRDIRPLMFFALYTIFFFIAGVGIVAGVAAFWPDAATRSSATTVTGVAVVLAALLSGMGLLADQMLTTTRFIHAIVRMQRIQTYNNPELFGPIHQPENYLGVRPQPRYGTRDSEDYARQTGDENGRHAESLTMNPVRSEAEVEDAS
jgi:glycosyltransferase involved in cell wall biosynthesis